MTYSTEARADTTKTIQMMRSVVVKTKYRNVEGMDTQQTGEAAKRANE